MPTPAATCSVATRTRNSSHEACQSFNPGAVAGKRTADAQRLFDIAQARAFGCLSAANCSDQQQDRDARALVARVVKPKSSETLDSPRIAVIPQGDVISSYKGARWSDPAPVLLRNRLTDAFYRDGRVQSISTDDSNLQADFELGGSFRRSRANTAVRRSTW